MRYASGEIDRAEYEEKKPYGRGCHGEPITVPASAIARWITTTEKVVLIDGCSDCLSVCPWGKRD